MNEMPTVHIQTSRADKVRIGPVSIITLVAVICLAVLAVLAASTAHATQIISDRQAAATQQLYLNERAGQELVAGIDGVIASLDGSSAQAIARSVDAQLDGICQAARDAGNGRVSCTAAVDGTTVTAEFACDDARSLSVAVTILDDGTYRIDRWKMASVQQEAPTSGGLWLGA
ncbi:MAG TPA: hypothetical protein DCP91_10525 [Eggerthellaceae bacterium]|nr:hypothetical protein [Eggerthellaceae bacterium]